MVRRIEGGAGGGAGVDWLPSLRRAGKDQERGGGRDDARRGGASGVDGGGEERGRMAETGASLPGAVLADGEGAMMLPKPPRRRVFWYRKPLRRVGAATRRDLVVREALLWGVWAEHAEK